jgi:hypothetical protein
VRRVAAPVPLDAEWGAPEWLGATPLEVNQFHPAGSAHRPRTQARLVYDAHALYGIFSVEDCYVRCVHVGFQSDVYEDACVEFFVQPKADQGYFNFEMNACGQLLCGYVEDPTRLPGGDLMKSERLPENLGRLVQVRGAFSAPVPEEIPHPIEWNLAFRIPLEVMEHYIGPLGDPQGQKWRANFNKCAENNSHPHWATWSPIGNDLNFHQPDKFGLLKFN